MPEIKSFDWEDDELPSGLFRIRHRESGKVIRGGFLGRESPPGETKDLHDRVFHGENLAEADLAEANLEGAWLKYRLLTGADLRGARLRRANLAGACLEEADLHGADLTDADLTDTDLTGARYDVHTRWPIGFDPRQYGSVGTN